MEVVLVVNVWIGILTYIMWGYIESSVFIRLTFKDSDIDFDKVKLKQHYHFRYKEEKDNEKI